jgi:hypothetical protein
MKKCILFASLFVFVFATNNTVAQTKKEVKEEIKAKDAKEDDLKGKIKERAGRSARREAKKYTRDGYLVSPGALPIDKQLEAAWMKSYDTDAKGFPIWFVANGKAIGESYTATKNQALNVAKSELAGLISTNVAGMAKNTIGNEQLSAQEATSIAKTIDASINLIAQELGQVLPVVEIYKNLPNKNVQVDVRIFYNIEMANETAKKIIRKKLEEEGALSHEKLEKLMGLDFNNVKNNSNVSDPEGQ